MPDAPPTVAVIILNWKRPDLTVKCLETVLAQTYPDFDVIVVDNASGDGSIGVLRTWAADRGLAMDERDAGSSRRGGSCTGPRSHLSLLVSDRNRGYGGGNNLGLMEALRRGYDACWVLNNDTTVEPQSLALMVRELQTDPRVGVVGACVLESEGSGAIQCVGGGLYSRWTSRAKLIAQGQPASDASLAHANPDFISGASMLISAALLRAVGGFEEGYFLYCEEIDIARRLRQSGWSMRVAPAAIVRHSMGATAGSHAVREQRSATSLFYSARSSVLLARKFNRAAVPTVVLARIALALSVAVHGGPRRGSSVVRGALAGLAARRWSHVPTAETGD